MKLFKKREKIELEKIELDIELELEKIELEKIITMIASEASELDISKKKNKIKIEIEKSFSIEDDFENHIIRRLINNKFKSLKIIQHTTTTSSTSSKIFLEFYVENDDDYFIEKLYERLRQIKRQNYNLKYYNLQQKLIKRKK